MHAQLRHDGWGQVFFYLAEAYYLHRFMLMGIRYASDGLTALVPIQCGTDVSVSE